MSGKAQITRMEILIVFLLVLLTPKEIIACKILATDGNKEESTIFCTIFSIAIGNTVLFGSNEDQRHSHRSSFISFVPPQEIPNTINLPINNETINVYGQVLVGSIIDGLYSVMGGMNDKGLCYDGNAIPREYLNEQESEQWIPLSGCWDLLWTCSSVVEVIDWFQTHSLPPRINWNSQLHFADATGDAVVVTATDGEVNFVGKGNDSYLVSTNFNRADPSSHYFGYPCPRYDKAVRMLEEITSEEKLTIETSKNILDAVHFEQSWFNDIKTLYSNVYDPVNTKIHLYYLYDFDNVVTFDLEEEYSKVDPTSTNYTLQDKLADATYMIHDFFPSRNYNPTPYLGNVIEIGVILAVPIFILIVLLMKRRKSKKKGQKD